jgi:hypothetical protein
MREGEGGGVVLAIRGGTEGEVSWARARVPIKYFIFLIFNF